MQTAHRRLAVRSSKRHPLRTVVIIVALITAAVVYVGGLQGIDTSINLSWLTDSIFG